MIKLADFPVVEIMAPAAICNSILLKLARMGVFVAIGTGRSQTGKLLLYRAIIRFIEMAFQACLDLVGTFKCPASL